MEELLGVVVQQLQDGFMQKLKKELIVVNGIKIKEDITNMANLFEIEQSMMNLLEYGVDDSTGEIIETEEDFNNLYNSIQLDLQTKIDNSNCLCKLIDGELEVIDKEIKRLQTEKKSRENKKEWIKKNVDNFIRRQFTDENGNLDSEGLNKYKLELPHSKISYRKSESVEVNDVSLLPKEYRKEKIEVSADKAELKKVLKSGKEINGAKLVTNINMQVK